MTNREVIANVLYHNWIILRDREDCIKLAQEIEEAQEKNKIELLGDEMQWCMHNKNIAGQYQRCLTCNPFAPSVKKIEPFKWSQADGPLWSEMIEKKINEIALVVGELLNKP